MTTDSPTGRQAGKPIPGFRSLFFPMGNLMGVVSNGYCFSKIRYATDPEECGAIRTERGSDGAIHRQG
ncbi:MAG: hypothetical protein ACK5PB_23370 [Pirellula sp.]